MVRQRIYLFALLPVLAIGCFEGTTPDPTYTKDEARRLGGISPDGSDICADQGWYDDGVCDSFCPEVDPECLTCPDPLDPEVHYVSTDPAECAAILYACPAGTEPFVDVPFDCGCGCIGTPIPGCEAMDVDMVGGCEPAPVYWWDGMNCIGESGCSCEGADCDDVYFSPAECEAAHERCFVPPGECDAQDARGEGACEAIVGIVWDGSACTWISGCSCVGSDCDETYDSIESCEADRRSCIGGTCDAQDARGEGACEALIGIAWDGESCTYLSGCSCVGTDCDSLYESEAHCQRDHRECFMCDPAPGDPGVDFVGNSPEECALIDFVCAPGSEYFSNDCGCGCIDGTAPTCEPQDIRGEGPCTSFIGVAWDGASCVAVGGCTCEGSDCDDLYEDQASCLRDHAECLSCDPAPGDPGVTYVGESPGECAVILFGCEEGERYFANDCGCGCEPDVPPTCEAQDARAVGGCEPAPFFIWNGLTCEPQTGCSCEGDDCDSVFSSEEACLRTYAMCDIAA